MTRRNRSRHHSELTQQNVYEKSIQETIRVVKIIKSSCNVCGRFKSRKFNNQMTTGSDFRD